jgi:hypothetical protein
LVDQVVDGEACGAVPRHMSFYAQSVKDKEHKESAAMTICDSTALQLCVSVVLQFISLVPSDAHTHIHTHTSPLRLYRSRRVVMLTVHSEG